MSGFEPARPRYTIPYAGKDYDLIGDLAMVEAVENALKEGIVQIAARTIDMGVTDVARLLSAMLTAGGFRTAASQVGQAIMDMGVNSDGFTALKLHIYAFLRIIMEPPEARERMARTMGEIVGKLNAPSASPGDSTRNSASAS